jgi:hypothetical protein
MIAREMLGSGLSPVAISAIIGSRSLTLTAAGVTQATATALPAALNVVTTCTEAACGAILAAYDIGDSVRVVNATANNLRVYPPVGGALNGGTTNAPFTLAGNSAADFVQTSALNFSVA